MQFKFGTDGWRGIISEDFTLTRVRIAARGIANYLFARERKELPLYQKSPEKASYKAVYRPPSAGMVVGYDSRLLSEDFARAASEVLASSQIPVYLSDQALPTPAVSLAVTELLTSGAIMITASHNPPEYTGVKLFNPDGMAFDSKQQTTIEKLIKDKNLELASWMDMQDIRTDKNAVSDHISMILSTISIKKKMKVVVDSGCGAASLTTPYLLREMGCDVVTLNSQPDGFFPGRGPEPKEESLFALRSVVLGTNADIGIAHDGDADRMVAVDERGEMVSNDKLLAFFGEYEAEKKMVVPVDASMLIDAVLPDVEIIRTRVGDVFVAEEIKRTGADFGGEASGTWIFPRVSYCPDGVYAASRLVELLSNTTEKFADKLSSMPEYVIKRGSAPYHGNMDKIGKELLALNFSEIDTIDGFRLTFDDVWVLVRPSGTEPLIRITVEGKTKQLVDELYNKIHKIIKG